MSGGCELCGDPLETGAPSQAFGGDLRRFCCPGCLNVYAILAESGLLEAGVDAKGTDLYKESLRLGLISRARQEVPVLPLDAPTADAVFQLTGLWCTSCGWVIEHALTREYGVVSAEVVFASDLLKVRFCPQMLGQDRIPGRVAALGYRAEPHGSGIEARREEWKDLVLRIGVAGALWMNVMLFSLVIYASYFEVIAEWARRAVPFILMGLAIPVVTYAAWPIHRIAWLGLRQGLLRMEALISAGVLAAFGYSAVEALRAGRHYYFDTACAIVTLVLVGKAMERLAKERSAEALSLLHGLVPKKARVRQEGHDRFVPTEDLRPGALILVKPGERIVADGVVRDGTSSVDESVVTGESEHLLKGPGDPVVCGSLNAAGVLCIEVTRSGEASTLAQIVRSVEQALASRTEIERTVDRVSRVFIPAVLLVALATALGAVALGLPVSEALMRATAVLVIACPCALGIATPLATTAAVGRASRQGILVRDAKVLETIRSIEMVAFDKTGTLTDGRFRLQGGEGAPLRLAASLESYSEHPLARAVVAAAQEQGLPLAPATGIEVHPGGGITGTVEETEVAVGSEAWMTSQGWTVPPDLAARAADQAEEGRTLAFVAVEGKAVGFLAFGDRLRSEAPEVIRELRARGIRTALISGDATGPTQGIARLLQVDHFRAEVPPQGKADAVRDFQEGGRRVSMVGDGINDAPALAAADLGIALGGGADLARSAAPVVVLAGTLTRIPWIIDLARKTHRVVRQNLFWAFFYNACGISLAITGVLNPILAAAAMVLSSAFVIGNSRRLAG
ncbi:MAG: heavy metal translocating P-type ATPase [Acidobacteria bacterium]|nr:heavy metal translocating P-type ATPase [Acidobacteriota bacterium]